MKYILSILIFIIPNFLWSQIILSPYGPATSTTTPVRTVFRIDTGIVLPANPVRGNIRITEIGLDIKKDGDTTWSAVSGGGDSGTVYHPGSGIRIENDSLKMGLKLAPPYTAGLLTETTYFLAGNPVGEYTALSLNPAMNTSQLIAVGGAGTGMIQVSPDQASVGQGASGLFINADEVSISHNGASDINVESINSRPISYVFDPTANLSALAVPPKSYIDAGLAAKADTATSYTRTAVNSLLAAKADTATSYTRTAVNSLLTLKANADSAFKQGGQSFGANAIIGTNDAFAFQIKTGGAAKLNIGSAATPTLSNGTTSNYGSIQMGSATTGFIFTRNTADTVTSFVFNQNNGSATGILGTFRLAGINKFSIAADGTLKGIATNSTTAKKMLVMNPDSTFRTMPLDTSVVSSGATLTLSTKGYYTFNGSTSTWTLPALAGNATTRYVIANKGSGNLVINGATNTIWEAGTVGSGTTLNAGQTATIYNDSLHWTISNKQ